MTRAAPARFIASRLLIPSLAFSLAIADCRRAPVPPAAPAPPIAARLEIPGLPNLGKVNDGLLRGGQPSPEGLRRLAAMGVAIVVDLRSGADEIAAERYHVEALGLRFVSIPMNGLQAPDHAQVASFLALLRDNPGRRVFVHCRRGAERTGVMVAAYRMAVEGWTPEQALDEMAAFHFRALFSPHLARYVRAFPHAYREDPAFRPR